MDEEHDSLEVFRVVIDRGGVEIICKVCIVSIGLVIDRIRKRELVFPKFDHLRAVLMLLVHLLRSVECFLGPKLSFLLS